MIAWGFDIAVVVISVVDVISDVVVAKEFYDDGHMLWFWLVFASLAISSLAYAILLHFGSIRQPIWFYHLGNKFTSSCPFAIPTFFGRVLQFFTALVVSQFIPMMIWYMETFCPVGVGTIEDGSEEELQRPDSIHMSRALSEELHDLAAESVVVQRIRNTMGKHFSRHGMFYIETVLESIPQSIIQLLAVTFLGRASSAQLLSLSLSLCSIVSKAYIVAQSSDMKVFVCKFFMVAHDVFGMFYIFSTILAADRVQEVALPLFGTKVSGISAAWFWKLLITVLCLLSSAFIFGAFFAVKEMRRTSNTWTGLFRESAFWLTLLSSICLAAALFVPIVLALELVKLLLPVILLFALEPSSNADKWLACLRMRTFVSRGKTWSEVRVRHYHVCKSYVNAAQCSVDETGMYDPSDHWNPSTSSEHMGTLLKDVQDPASEWSILKPFWEISMNFRFVKDIPKEPISFQAAICFFLMTLVVAACGSVFSVCFPFINFALHRDQHNAFQTFCFTAIVVSLVAVLSLSRPLFRFALFSASLQPPMKDYCLSSRAVAKWITEYYKPKTFQIISVVVPRSLFPAELAQRLGSFLGEFHIDKRTLSMDESLRMLEEKLV